MARFRGRSSAGPTPSLTPAPSVPAQGRPPLGRFRPVLRYGRLRFVGVESEAGVGFGSRQRCRSRRSALFFGRCPCDRDSLPKAGGPQMLKLTVAVLAIALAGSASAAGWRSLRVDGASEAAFSESVVAFQEKLSPVRRYVFASALHDIWALGTKNAEAEQREYTESDYLRQLDGLGYDEVVTLTDPTGDTAKRRYKQGRDVVYAALRNTPSGPANPSGPPCQARLPLRMARTVAPRVLSTVAYGGAGRACSPRFTAARQGVSEDLQMLKLTVAVLAVALAGTASAPGGARCASTGAVTKPSRNRWRRSRRRCRRHASMCSARR